MKNKLVLAAIVAVLLSGTAAVAHDMDGKGGHPGWGKQCHDKGPDASLPADKEKLVHESMHKVFDENKPLFHQMEALHKEVHDIMAADKFDSKAYLEKTVQLDAIQSKIRKNMERGVAEIAGRLSPDERKAFLARWMDKEHGHSWGHHEPGRHDGEHHWHGNDGHENHPSGTDDNGGSPRHDEN